jgi:hypothetical protein
VGAKRCHKALKKAVDAELIQRVDVPKQVTPSRSQSMDVTVARFDTRSDDGESDDESYQKKLLPGEYSRPTPDGDFDVVQLDDNPERKVKIGHNLPVKVREDLVTCLKENADLFACSPSEMSGIDPKVACHELNVNEAFPYIAQRRRRQSPEKAKAAQSIVDGLVKANFI